MDRTADISRIKESANSLSTIHRESKGNSNPADGLGVGSEQDLVDVFDAVAGSLRWTDGDETHE